MGWKSRTLILLSHAGIMFFGALLMGGGLVLVAEASDIELSGFIAYPAGFVLFHLLLRALQRLDDEMERRAAMNKRSDTED